MPRKLFIAGNWKMNLNRAEATELAKGLAAEIGSVDAVDLAVCPPFVYLADVAAALAGTTPSAPRTSTMRIAARTRARFPQP